MTSAASTPDRVGNYAKNHPEWGNVAMSNKSNFTYLIEQCPYKVFSCIFSVAGSFFIYISPLCL